MIVNTFKSINNQRWHLCSYTEVGSLFVKIQCCTFIHIDVHLFILFKNLLFFKRNFTSANAHRAYIQETYWK